MIAVLSDIHGNLEALDAVLEDILDCNVRISKIILLGDLVDYGADSVAVINKFYEMTDLVYCCIKGNHEEAVFKRDCSRYTTDHGKLNFLTTLEELDRESLILPKLRGLCSKEEVSLRRTKFVHGSEGNLWGSYGKVRPVKEIFPYDKSKLMIFGGHTHIQGWNLVNEGSAYYINPGSVGQPRNGDSRAQYALVEESFDHVVFNRVKYDVDTAAKKIIRSGRPRFLASRLYLGI